MAHDTLLASFTRPAPSAAQSATLQPFLPPSQFQGRSPGLPRPTAAEYLSDSMASRRQSPAPPKRPPLALKRADGDPLTRADIQYDVLNAVFSDKTAAFTDPYDAVEDAPKLCFRDLYIKAIMHSSKATKALKDKMSESPVFAEDFAMLGLLVNVGRINTTMSCEHDRFGSHSCDSLLTDAPFLSSFSRNEDCDSNLSPYTHTSAFFWKPPRCSSHQTYSKAGPFGKRGH